MIVKTSPCAMSVPDGDVAREVHHADHHGEARHGADHRRRHAGPRGGSRSAARRRSRRRPRVVVAERLRVGPHAERRSPGRRAVNSARGEPRARRARVAVSARSANIGPKTSGPQIAPETTPKSTIDMPRARRSGGNISAAAARESRTIDCAAPHRPSPRNDERRRIDRAAAGGDDRADHPEHEAGADHGHPPDPVGETARPGRRRARRRSGRRPARARGSPGPR